MPAWMDSAGTHGDAQFLILKPVGNSKLPNPFIIAKTVDQAVGRIDSAKPTEGGSSYILKVRSHQQAEKLIKINQLIDGSPIVICMHPTLNLTQCIVSCREVFGMSDKELQEGLAEQGVTRVYRFVKKVDGKDEPTNTMVLTVKGTTAPTHVYFGYIRAQTRPYYPRPLMCYKCGKYGHTKTRCEHNEACMQCGVADSHPKCTKDPFCLNCGGPHPATSRTCPKQVEEQAIVRIRVDLGISQSAAVKEFRSRCEAARNASSVQHRIEAARTINQFVAKDQRIKELENIISKLTAQLNKLQATPKPSIETEVFSTDSTLTAQFNKLQTTPQPNIEDEEFSTDSDDTMMSETSTASSTPKRGRNRDSSEERSARTEVELRKKQSQPSPNKPNLASKKSRINT